MAFNSYLLSLITFAQQRQTGPRGGTVNADVKWPDEGPGQRCFTTFLCSPDFRAVPKLFSLHSRSATLGHIQHFYLLHNNVANLDVSSAAP